MVRNDLDTGPRSHGHQRNAVDVAGLLSRADRSVRARLSRLLAVEGSSLDDWRVLSLLQAGGQSMTAIAEATLLPPPTLTKRIDRLVSGNLVHRRADEADRRRVLVLLTPRGQALHDRLAPVVAEEQAQLTAVVAEHVEPATLAAALRALADPLPQPDLP